VYLLRRNKTCYTRERFISHIRASHVTHTREPVERADAIVTQLIQMCDLARSGFHTSTKSRAIGRDELARPGAKDRPERGLWRPICHARGWIVTKHAAARPQRRRTALFLERHHPRVRGDGSAKGRAHGVGRAHCAAAQLPSVGQNGQVHLLTSSLCVLLLPKPLLSVCQKLHVPRAGECCILCHQHPLY